MKPIPLFAFALASYKFSFPERSASEKAQAQADGRREGQMKARAGGRDDECNFRGSQFCPCKAQEQLCEETR